MDLTKDRPVGVRADVSEARPVDWTAYAECYDLLLEHNPAYRDLIARLGDFLRRADWLAEDAAVLDIGAGTGNFAQAVRAARPGARLTLVEPDAGMRGRALTKTCGAVVSVAIPFEDWHCEATFDLLVCTHALYTMPEPEARLEQMARLTRPGGRLFLIDLGRRMRVWDWRLYLVRHLIGSVGLRETLRLLVRGREIVRANAFIAKAQREGRFWTHSPRRLRAALERTGWTVEHIEPVYRGYSTLAIAVRGVS